MRYQFCDVNNWSIKFREVSNVCTFIFYFYFQSSYGDTFSSVSSSFLRNQVKINVKKRIVTIPKICDVYRNDFGLGDRLVCLSQLLRYLDESNQILIANLLENGGQITVRFRELSERFHPNLLQFDDKCQFTPEL